MRDPFTDLRAADSPVSPDPTFATRLRERLERALALPRGVRPMTATAEPVARPRGAAVPYLAVTDARRAIDWYVEIFGASLVGEPIVMPDGRIGHAELALPDGMVYLADEYPEIGVVAPRGGASVSLMLAVPDADEVRGRALAAGATGERPPYDAYGTRNAWIVDPFGHRWGLNSPLRTVSTYRHGDVGYVSLWVPDPAAAARFYADVLDWEITASGQVAGTTPEVGLWRTDEGPNVFCCYAVDDVDAAIERVRAAGGTSATPSDEAYGRRVDCVDDQGTRFALYAQPPGHTGERPPANGRRTGDLAYLTFEVVDSARARAFYGAVLGWTFSPGHVADGWQVEGTAPMAGLSGGHERATAVPMWRVDDVAAAVDRVRALGGTASDPARQPYGETSNCTDPQGMRFYLGAL